MATKTRLLPDSDRRRLEYSDILIYTAIEGLESDALERHLERVGASRAEPVLDAERLEGVERWRLKSDKGEDLQIIVRCLRAAGNGTAGVELTHFLHGHYRPKLVCFCGIAGSLDPTQAQLGQVVVSESIHWRGFDKIQGKDRLSLEMRKKPLRDHEVKGTLVNLAKAFARENERAENPAAKALFDTSRSSHFAKELQRWMANLPDELKEDLETANLISYVDSDRPVVRFGKVMSWDYVLNNKGIREEIKAQGDKFLIVEMESGGMSFAIKKAIERWDGDPIRPELFVVRGVSDLCNMKADDVFRDLAADHAASFLCGFIKSAFKTTF